MNKQQAIEHILDQLAHGIPIQSILDPPCPQIEVIDPETMEEKMMNDPDWVKPKLPTWTTVVDWLRDESFRRKWEHARKMGAQYKADYVSVLAKRLEEESDPRMASKYKVMLEMHKTAATWDDSKFSDRSVVEVKNTAPQTPESVLARINQIERELGLGRAITGDVVDVQATEVPAKKAWVMTPARAENIRKAQEARRLKAATRRGSDDPDPGRKTGKA